MKTASTSISIDDKESEREKIRYIYWGFRFESV